MKKIKFKAIGLVATLASLMAIMSITSMACGIMPHSDEPEMPNSMIK